MSYFALPILFVCFSGIITLVWEAKADFLPSIAHNFVGSFRRGFLFLSVLRIGFIVVISELSITPFSISY